MKKPLLVSFIASSLLFSHLHAESMYERIQSIEFQIEMMQSELKEMKERQEKALQKKKETFTTLEIIDSQGIIKDVQTKSSVEKEQLKLKEEIKELQESISELYIATNNNHLKFNVDYRFSIDNLNYKMAGKDSNGEDEQSNDAFMSHRLLINMNWKANENLSFTAQMAYNKAFGSRGAIQNPQNASYETFDWITNENAYDDLVRIRCAYFFYKNDTFIGSDIPWTFSIGRRPSTNGHLINLRENDRPSSPMGHTINVEFDGMSTKFDFEDLTGIDGTYFKFCAGRGLTNALPKFTPTPYTTDATTIPDMDLVGLIFVPYNDGQYSIATQYYYAHNLIDTKNPLDQTAGFTTVGNLHSFTANFTMNGIGDEWSDYLDDTLFFISGAISKTDPKDRSAESVTLGYDPTGMLGSQESESGYSLWVGLKMPSLLSEDGEWGVEYNKGSQYWRSITYAEDTNIGSKLATRGDAYEIYFTEPIIDETLTFQIRYTYIDYQYTGSNGFFGNTTGTALRIEDIQKVAASGDAQMSAMASQIVDIAQDIRFYIRYRY